MKFNKKYWPPIALSFLFVFGFASVTILGKYNYFINHRTDIFEKTKNECPGIRWVRAVDSTQRSYPVEIKGDLYFAGERVPLEDPEVKERLERELEINVNWHSNTLLAMKLANRYFGDIEKELEKDSLPTDFKYMALVESGFRLEPSPAGAAGYWQFIKSTAHIYNLEVTEDIDERYNMEKATRAACTYLKDAKDKLGNWTLAAASYNLGVPYMEQKVKEQRTNDYYDMYFNPETSRYVFRMLAMKIIFSYPKQAGFIVRPDELYQPYKYKTVEVDSSIANIADFAAQFGLKYKHIKMLNPWLRDAQMPNREHRKYEIKILEAD